MQNKPTQWTRAAVLLSLAGVQSLACTTPAMSDGPTDAQLQGSLSAGSTSGPLTNYSNISNLPITVGGVTTTLAAQLASLQAGNASALSNTIFLPAAGAAPASVGARLARLPDPKDFGATGNAIRGVLYQAAASGSSSVVLTNLGLNGGISPPLGAMVMAAGTVLPAGTIVTSVVQNSATANTPLTTTVSFSNPLQQAVPLTNPGFTYFDFSVHDDTAAFTQAYQAAAASGVGAVHVSPGLYSLNGAMPQDPTVTWQFDNAELTQQGSIVAGYNFGLQRQPTGKLFMKSLVYPDNENHVAIETSFLPTNSTHQYQKNALSLQVYDDDPGCLSEVTGVSCNGSDGSADIGRGAVGLSIQANPDVTNHTYNLWGQETQIVLPSGSEGAVTDAEFAIVNNSGADNLEMGSLFNKSAATFLGNGTNIMAAAIWVSGQKWQTGIDISTSVLGKAWAVRTEGNRGAGGVATTHTDMAYADHAGNLFGQSLHIVTGGTTGDTDPTGGLTITGDGSLTTTGSLTASSVTAGNASLQAMVAGAQSGVGGVAISNIASGQIDIGNSTLSGAALAPTIRLHKGSATASDTYDLELQDTGSALRLTDGSGNQLAYFSMATGMQGSTVSTSNTDGVVANFGSSLAVQLTGSGFDMVNELSGKAFAIHTAGGYNATFANDGSTSFTGPITQSAADGVAGAGAAISTATLLSKHTNHVTSCPSGSGLQLPAGATSGGSNEIVVINRSGSTCLVYPPSGGTIESGGVNAGVSVASGSDQVFRSMSPTAWYQ